MKKYSTKAVALIACFALVLTSACSYSGSGRKSSGGRTRGGDSKREGGRETSTTYSTVDPTDPSDPTSGTNGDPVDYIPTSDSLTYPDHVATYEEIHPEHQPGNISGKEATELLASVENDILHSAISDYSSIEIYFKEPEKLGYSADDVSWGGIESAEDFPEIKQFFQDELDTLLTINYEDLSKEDRLCFDKLVYDCEEDIYLYSYTAFEYYTMIFNYLVGPQTTIMFTMDVIEFDTVKDAENYILLIKDIDRYYDGLCEYEETRASLGFASSDNSYEEAAKSFDGLVSQKDSCFLYDSFEERLDNISGLSSDDKDRLISEHDDAMKNIFFPEFEECADRMRALKGSGGIDAGLCRYRGGDAYYAALNRRLTNCGDTIEENVALLDSEIDMVLDDITTIATSGFGWYDEYINHDYTKGDVEENLDYLYDAVKTDFPEIPAHQYTLMDVPKDLEENFSPAAYLSYHFDSTEDNVIIVNNGSVGSNLGTTLAHEGYPGHMFQSLYTRTHTDHLYMMLGASIGYVEGWATYVQYYSMRYFTGNGVTDAMKLVADEEILNLLVSTRLDYGINCEDWSLADCVDYFNTLLKEINPQTDVKEEDFAEFYTLLITDPGYYVKYGMGYVFTQQIMDDMRANYSNATDLEIHTAYLNSLTGTFEQIRKNMESELG